MRPAAPPASHATQYPPHVSPPGIPQARVKENVRPLFPQAAPQALQPAFPARQVAGPPALPVPVVRLSQQPNLMARILHGPSPLSRQPSNVELHQLGPVRTAKARRRAGPH
ncbi:hypothetical protein WOLCODRAFT_137875 [Wolfiporia cocos MD-104 SS10]|uniref:Uncharacterized protein n=1 Tax=Wolfiporia cocos (strain MD-104) TaxID=742152 RepID=A0A2H3JJL1_WOLCO|nr:hypothetical protein WOLCODRAFT_137875 [Wolfiporia cocos MD-104 SS10]